MGYGCNVLRAYHIMIGCDFHDLWPPGTPTPAGVGPHPCVAPLIGTTATSKYGSTVHGHSDWTMLRGTDIGPLIPHIPLVPNVLIAPIILLSGSKSEFGASSVLVEGKPIAIAVGVKVNINLNCCGPVKRPPLPTGLVLTFNTIEANVTLGDVLAGAAAMVVDAAIEWGINLVFNGIGNRFFGPLSDFYNKVFFGRVFNVLARGRAGEYLYKGIFYSLPLLVGSTLTGSPLGYAPDWSPAGGVLGNQIDKGHDALRAYIDDDSVEEHPSAPPDAGTGGNTSDSGSTTGNLDAGVGEGDADAGNDTSSTDAGVVDDPDAGVGTGSPDAGVGSDDADAGPGPGPADAGTGDGISDAGADKPAGI